MSELRTTLCSVLVAMATAAVGCGDDTSGGGGSAPGEGGAAATGTAQGGGGATQQGAGGEGTTTTGGGGGEGGSSSGGGDVESCMFVGGRLEGARNSNLQDRNEAGGHCGYANVGGSPIGYKWDVLLEDGEELTVFLDIEGLDDGVVGALTARYFIAGSAFDPQPLWESEPGACAVIIESNELDDQPDPLPDEYEFVGTVTCSQPADGPQGELSLVGEIRFSNDVHHSQL